ncbi:MAG: hypothetical protein H7833_05815 [Magnetococcus sp. DMHC-1]|nr:hypothetical protein [Magnetococcales bacterium]
MMNDWIKGVIRWGGYLLLITGLLVVMSMVPLVVAGVGHLIGWVVLT